LDYNIEFTQELKEFIVEKGIDQQFGARPLKREIQRRVEDPLSEAILENQGKEKKNIKVTVKKDKTKIEIS
jgi:ATP-dependent Clp protease ATP-binding subunit ClpA